MKKILAVLLSLVLISAVFTGCASPQGATAAPSTEASSSAAASEEPGTPADTLAPTETLERATINVVYHPTIGGSTAIATGITLGYFEEQNLQVNLQMYTSGPPEIAAMVAGQADVGFIGPGAAWLAFNGNVNIVALDNIALTEEIIVRSDSGIASIKDLAGKTIAVQEGAAGYTLLLVALKENGMSVSDIKVLNIANDNLASTYNDSSIDCWAGWKPATTSLITALGGEGTYTLLANNASFPSYAFPCTWVANKDFVANHADILQRFITALTKAQVYRAANPQQACAYASTYAQQATNDLTGQLADAIFPTLDEFDTYYNTDGFVNMLENLKNTQASKVTESLQMSDIYIDTFAKAAVAALQAE
jgi:NitT/TauT family transport system substrate-binding protein